MNDSGKPRGEPQRARIPLLTRRLFLTGGLALAGTAALTGGYVLSRKALVAQAIQRHYWYLDLDLEGVHRFINEFESEGRWIRKNPLKLMKSPEGPTLQYLASSDFFFNGADEHKPVHYIALYGTRSPPCFNPFSLGPLTNEELDGDEGRSSFASRNGKTNS